MSMPVDLSHIAKDLQGLAKATTTLKQDPHNARTHSERNIVATMKSLKEFGQQKPVVALKSGTVIAGNGTLTAAQRLAEDDSRWTRLAVSIFSSEADARAYAIADNRTAELAEWDFETLAETFRDLPQADWDKTGFLAYEVEPMLEADWTPPAKTDLPDRAKGHTVSLTEEEMNIFNQACAVIVKRQGAELTRGQALVSMCREVLK